MAETYALDAQPRSITGKKVSQLRTQGLVPVVVYGSLMEPVSLQIPYRPLQVALMKVGGTQLLDIQVNGSTHTVLAREVQRDVVRGDILHVDFLAVDMSEKIVTTVPVHIVGESPIVETRQGQVSQVANSLQVEALPRDLVSSIEVDISGLTQVGDGIYVRDLNLSDKLTVLSEEDELIVHILPIVVQPVEEEGEEEESTAGEPEVIRRERDEDEED